LEEVIGCICDTYVAHVPGVPEEDLLKKEDVTALIFFFIQKNKINRSWASRLFKRILRKRQWKVVGKRERQRLRSTDCIMDHVLRWEGSEAKLDMLKKKLEEAGEDFHTPTPEDLLKVCKGLRLFDKLKKNKNIMFTQSEQQTIQMVFDGSSNALERDVNFVSVADLGGYPLILAQRATGCPLFLIRESPSELAIVFSTFLLNVHRIVQKHTELEIEFEDITTEVDHKPSMISCCYNYTGAITNVHPSAPAALEELEDLGVEGSNFMIKIRPPVNFLATPKISYQDARNELVIVFEKVKTISGNEVLFETKD